MGLIRVISKYDLDWVVDVSARSMEDGTGSKRKCRLPAAVGCTVVFGKGVVASPQESMSEAPILPLATMAGHAIPLVMVVMGIYPTIYPACGASRRGSPVKRAYVSRIKLSRGHSHPYLINWLNHIAPPKKTFSK